VCRQARSLVSDLGYISGLGKRKAGFDADKIGVEVFKANCVDMALFARMKAYLWQDVLELKHGLPSHDTFSRVFRMLDPGAFENSCFSFAQGPTSSAGRPSSPSTSFPMDVPL
jgi:hypothetical protein